MLRQFINKSWNIDHFDDQKEYGRLATMDKIDNVYYERREIEEVVKTIDFKKLLKDNGVKAVHLLSDIKAEEKAKELWLI